ncbi:MAG TPA: hypothetical protein VLZ12_13730, partial [Verrucomicrobiae bacterium]|nr:hypothetical protein [Verrucomicrobiae bacterium]
WVYEWALWLYERHMEGKLSLGIDESARPATDASAPAAVAPLDGKRELEAGGWFPARLLWPKRSDREAVGADGIPEGGGAVVQEAVVRAAERQAVLDFPAAGEDAAGHDVGGVKVGVGVATGESAGVKVSVKNGVSPALVEKPRPLSGGGTAVAVGGLKVDV